MYICLAIQHDNLITVGQIGKNMVFLALKNCPVCLICKKFLGKFLIQPHSWFNLNANEIIHITSSKFEIRNLELHCLALPFFQSPELFWINSDIQNFNVVLKMITDTKGFAQMKINSSWSFST